jgi:adenylylsulfate kinase
MKIENPYTLWLLGPTSSGKSTIAEQFVRELVNNDATIIHYDGDEIRDFFGKEFGFNENNRGRVVETLAHLAKKANDAGINVIVSALTAHQSARDYISKNIPNLLVGYVTCPIDVCAERDPKGLYQKAKNGEIDTLIGYNSEYIAPNNPDLILDTNSLNVEENVQRLIEHLNINFE